MHLFEISYVELFDIVPDLSKCTKIHRTENSKPLASYSYAEVFVSEIVSLTTVGDSKMIFLNQNLA